MKNAYNRATEPAGCPDRPQSEARRALASALILGALMLILWPCIALGQTSRVLSRPGPTTGVVLVTIVPEGVFPKRVSRGTGAFFIRIENRSGIPELNLDLIDTKANQRLLESRHRNGQEDLLYAVELEPGDYALIVRERPQWRLDLVITNKK